MKTTTVYHTHPNPKGRPIFLMVIGSKDSCEICNKKTTETPPKTKEK